MRKEHETSVVVRRSRPGMGLGLFVSNSIEKGEFIISYKGEIITTREADKRNTRYIFAFDDEYAIDGGARDNLARYMNHFCRPNVEADIEAGQIRFYALHDVKADEELGYDYGREHFEKFIASKGCRCAACAR